MSKVQPFRDASITRPEDLRTRLNELVSVVNERAGRWRTVRIANVRPGNLITLPNPGFPVGAVVLGGVTPTNGGPTGLSPWVSWHQQADGRITVSIDGLTGASNTYAVNLVLFEGEAS